MRTAGIDDIIDVLSFHKLISEDKTFDTRVLHSFRTDNLLLIRRGGYSDHIAKLNEVSGVKINDFETLKEVIANRLDFFSEMGCRCTDLGIPIFQNRIADDNECNNTFKTVLWGNSIPDEEYNGFVGNMYVFLSRKTCF